MELGAVGLAAFCVTNLVGFATASVSAAKSGAPEYAFCASVLVFGLAEGVLESGLVGPTFLGFLNLVLLACLALPREGDSPLVGNHYHFLRRE